MDNVPSIQGIKKGVSDDFSLILHFNFRGEIRIENIFFVKCLYQNTP